MLLVLQRFGQKLKNRLNDWVDDGLWWKVRGSTITEYAVGTMNVCTKFHGYPSKTCWDISQRNEQKCQPNIGAIREVRASP